MSVLNISIFFEYLSFHLEMKKILKESTEFSIRELEVFFLIAIIDK